MRGVWLKIVRFGLGLSLLLPFVAEAQMPVPTIRPEFRTDLEWNDNNNETDPNLSRPRLLFRVQRAHLNIQGNITPDLDYRLRVQWNQDFEPDADNTGPGLEYWYVRQQVSDGIQVRLGKHFILQGGRESAHNPIDVFGYSTVGETVQEFYEVGASAFVNLGTFAEGFQDHTLIVQVFNQVPGGTENQFALTTNIAWYGVVADGLVEPIVQFGVFPHVQEREEDALTGKRVLKQEEYSETFLSLGALVNLDFATLELDLLSHNRDSFQSRNASGTITETESQDNTSLIVFAQTDNGSYRPFVKWINDTVKIGDSNSDDLNTFQIGAEYFPQMQYMLYRLHGLVSYEEKQEGGNEYEELGINIGLSARL